MFNGNTDLFEDASTKIHITHIDTHIDTQQLLEQQISLSLSELMRTSFLCYLRELAKLMQKFQSGIAELATHESQATSCDCEIPQSGLKHSAQLLRNNHAKTKKRKITQSYAQESEIAYSRGTMWILIKYNTSTDVSDQLSASRTTPNLQTPRRTRHLCSLNPQRRTRNPEKGVWTTKWVLKARSRSRLTF